ncbi:MAG: hypothetical protein AAGD14_00905 [Planctomycetota bacterium]
MLRAAPLLFCALIACGGGGDSSAAANEDGAAQRTVEEVFQECAAFDATAFASLLETLQGFTEPGAEVPLPQLDLLGGLLSGGNVPYEWDLDGNGTPDATGVLRFIDAEGNTTIPFSLADLAGGMITDLESALANVPDGTRLSLTFELADSLVSGLEEADGAGELILTLFDGEAASASGQGVFGSGPCRFEFDFADVDLRLEDLADGFPQATFAFDARAGEDVVVGSIAFDGTSLATVRARLNDEPEEVFELDLAAIP